MREVRTHRSSSLPSGHTDLTVQLDLAAALTEATRESTATSRHVTDIVNASEDEV